MSGKLDWDDERYFADTDYISNSMLSVFHQSPAIYRARFIDKKIAFEPTDEMRLGTLVHTLLFLGEDTAAEQYYVITKKPDRRTKAGKQRAAEIEQESAGKIVLDEDTWRRALRMVEELSVHNVVSSLVSSASEMEDIHWWRDEKYSINCKCKIDALSDGIIVDLKTSSNPHPNSFGRSVANFGYYRQAAWYRRAVAATNGGTKPPFVFCVVGSSEPHEVFCYSLTEEDMKYGDLHCDDLLGRLVTAKQHNQWDHPGSSGICTIELPGWFKSQPWS